jgi:ABC-type transporter Mla subunit MlaD
MEDLGHVDAPNLVLSNLALEWPGLVRNLTTLDEMVATAKKGNKDVASALNEEVQTISRQRLLILSKLGDRMENVNGASAFEVVDKLKTQVRGMAKGMGTVEELVQRLNNRSSKLTIGLEDLTALVQILKRNGGITSTDLTESRNSVLNQVREAIQPFIKLVRRLSSSKEDPGGLLMKRVMDLERTVVELRATKADTTCTSLGKTTSWKDPPAPASTPSLSWSLSTEPGTTGHTGTSVPNR